jgi:hypothetical protein
VAIAYRSNLSRKGQASGRLDETLFGELAMRAQLVRHFDVVVVVWALALLVGLSIATLSHSQLSNAQWDHAPQAGAVWVVPADGAGN